MKFVKVMKEEELPIGKSAIIAAGDKQIALFNYKGKLENLIKKGLCIS